LAKEGHVKSYYVNYKSQRKGPIPQDQLIRALQDGKVPPDAELVDAATHDIVLESDLLNPQPVVELAQKKAIDYGRPDVAERNPRLAYEVQQLRYEVADAKESNYRILLAIIAFLICGPLGLLVALHDSRKETNWAVVVVVCLLFVVFLAVVAFFAGVGS
jgi:hypothetical protein